MRNNQTLPFLIALIFLGLSLWLVPSHELWRDELQAWLLARDSRSFPELFKNLKYEGHPGLWHSMLFPLTRLDLGPVAMQYLHVLIATCTIFVLVKWSPFNTTQKVLLVFSYFLFYEYSLIARNYGLGVLLIFIFCALFPKRRQFPLSIAISLFLLSHTSVHGLIIALCLFSTLCFEEFFSKKTFSYKLKFSASYLSAIAIILAGFITAVIQLIPPPDSGFQTGWHFYFSAKRFITTCAAIVAAYFPIPEINLNFWNSRFVLSNNFFIFTSFIAVCIYLYVISRFLIKRPSAFFLYLSTTSALILFFYVKYSGGLRHHGFLFIALISSLWVYQHCESRQFFQIPKRFKEVKFKTLNYLITILFAIHACAAIIAVTLEIKYPFSSAQQTADFLKREGLTDATIIGDASPAVSAVAGHYKNKIFYYADADRYGTFIRWDNKRLKLVTAQSLYDLSLRFATSGNDVVLVLNRELENHDKSRWFQLLYQSDNAVVDSEVFFIYNFLFKPKSKLQTN